MVYQGSKAKLRKYILPILQNCINENHIDDKCVQVYRKVTFKHDVKSAETILNVLKGVKNEI